MSQSDAKPPAASDAMSPAAAEALRQAVGKVMDDVRQNLPDADIARDARIAADEARKAGVAPGEVSDGANKLSAKLIAGGHTDLAKIVNDVGDGTAHLLLDTHKGRDGKDNGDATIANDARALAKAVEDGGALVNTEITKVVGQVGKVVQDVTGNATDAQIAKDARAAADTLRSDGIDAAALTRLTKAGALKFGGVVDGLSPVVTEIGTEAARLLTDAPKGSDTKVADDVRAIAKTIQTKVPGIIQEVTKVIGAPQHGVPAQPVSKPKTGIEI